MVSELKIGLTLGKFAPLHRGHQFVIETALAEMDRLIVLIYDCPDTTPIPLQVRSAWIRDLYPTVEVIEVWDGPAVTGNAPAIHKLHDDHLHGLVGARGLTHFYSSEFYGEHVSRGLGVVDRRIDPERKQHPISGTLIRSDPFAFRHLMSPRVYRDLVANVLLIGAPSTGKSTLAERLAQHHGTVWMPEYGREYWHLHQIDRRLSPSQLVEIAEEHLRREQALLHDANRFLFSDTNALTTYLFSHYYHGFAEARLIDLADKASTRYDLVFLCEPDIPYDDSWDRSGEVNRNIFHRQTLGELSRRRIPYFALGGSIDQRMARANQLLLRFSKFQNPAESFRVAEL